MICNLLHLEICINQHYMHGFAGIENLKGSSSGTWYSGHVDKINFNICRSKLKWNWCLSLLLLTLLVWFGVGDTYFQTKLLTV